MKFASLLLLSLGSADAHRADEYLQATTISLEKGRVEAQIRLTPGITVFPVVMAAIDADGDAAISPAEQQAYAARVLADLSLQIDGNRAKLRLVSTAFPNIDELREGLGEIKIDFAADVPARPSHNLIFDNRHQRPISAYLVNCLAPSDPDIQVAAQRRNYEQFHYELEYIQRGVEASARSLLWWLDIRAVLALFTILLLLRLAIAKRRQRA